MVGVFANAAKKNGGKPIRLKFLAVLRPFFTSVNQDRNKAWGWLGLMLALLVLESGVLVAFSYTQVRRWCLVCARTPVLGMIYFEFQVVPVPQKGVRL